MKIKFKKRRFTSVLCLSVLMMVSCSKESKEVYYLQSPSTILDNQNEQLSQEVLNDKKYEAWKKLVVSDQKNVALADVLSVGVPEVKKKEILELVSLFSLHEINQIVEEVQLESESLKKQYLFNGERDLETEYNYNSIFSARNNKKQYESEADLLIVSVSRYAQSKAINSILTSYNNIITENSKDIAKDLIVNIAEQKPELANEIINLVKQSNSQEEFSEKLKKSEEYVKLVDQYFQASGSNIKEQLTFLATASVGGLIYLHVKDTPDFQKLKEKFIEIKTKVEEVKAKVEQVKKVVTEIKSNWQKNEELQKELSGGLTKISSGMKDTFSSAKHSIKNDNVDGRKMMEFLVDTSIFGKENKSKSSNPTIFSKQNEIKEGLNTVAASAGKLAHNFDSLLAGAEKISEITGVKIPKDLQKAINTAKKVSQGVQIASTIASGIMSGGVLSAVNMLSTGPLSGMLGLGANPGPDPQIMEALGRIEEKVDQLAEQQKKMIELQKETLKMIRDLALAIDEYHQNEMKFLDDIRDYSLANLEISKTLLNTDITMCESMIDFKLMSLNYRGVKRNATYAGSRLEYDFDNFYKNIKDLNGLKKFVTSTYAYSYSDCQRGISKAFGSLNSDSNPILSIYNADETNNLYSFNKNQFKPLVELLNVYYGSNHLRNVKYLSFPSDRISSLESKSANLNSKSHLNLNNNLDLDKLISPKALERYTSSLLIFYPILDIEQQDWKGSFEDIVNSYYSGINLSYGNELNDKTIDVSRSYYFLRNALNLIQLSIAQEAIIAGESLIPFIYKDLNSKIFNGEPCEKVTNEKMQSVWSQLSLNSVDGDPVCAIRSNKLLLKNYLKYSAFKSLNEVTNLISYKKAYEESDFKKLATYFEKDSLSLNQFINENGVIKYKVNAGIKGSVTKVTLPTMEDLENAYVTYSESMNRLVMLQNNTLKALIKVTPTEFRNVETREKYAQMSLLKYFE